MSSQRKLNALLFELQTARSPLAQAKILARSWRTLRELSPTDRRLLARHAGFDGAEQILEGLAGKQKVFAPSTLLQLLDRARSTDGAAVNEMLTALRDPSQRREALGRGADMAAELLREDEEENVPEAISEALGELHSVERDVLETPEEALAALNALEDAKATPKPAKPPGSARSDDDGMTAHVHSSQRATKRPRPKPPLTVPDAGPQTPRPTPRRAALMAEWDLLDGVSGQAQPASKDDSASSQTPVIPKSSLVDPPAVLSALGAGASAFSRLRVLDREIDGVRGSTLDAIRGLLETFPGGWVRRRALVALISAGIPDSASQALELIAGLEREVDRRWCLGALAQRDDFKGAVLRKSLDLVASPAGRRRLQILSERG